LVGFRFSKKYSSKTKLDDRLTDSKIVTFLINGVGHENKLNFSLFIFLQPEQKKCGLFFINPISNFDKSTIENLGDKALDTMIMPIERITSFKVNYTINLTEKAFIDLIDIIEGLPVFLDNFYRNPTDNYVRGNGLYTMSGEEVVDFIQIRDREDPLSYIDRLNSQESIFLALYDRIKEKNEMKVDIIKLLFSKSSTNLTLDDSIALYKYIKKNHLFFSIGEMPGQLIEDDETKLSVLKINEKSASEGFGRLTNYLSSADYNIGDLARTEVLNSTDTTGLAKSVKSILNENGIKVLSVGNGWNSNEKYSAIIDRSGNTEYAYRIAKVLNINRVFHLINKEIGLDITVLLGEDFDFKNRK
jgi:polyisoprenyl-teichoic acid--peptidoglycan teichoic acid transferase